MLGIKHKMKIGVLAIQGDYEAHKTRLEELGYRIGEDGSLTPVTRVDGLPLSAVGVVAR